MNIIATSVLIGAFVAVPGAGVGLADYMPKSPIDGISVSAAGLGVEIDADGVRAEPSKARDFEIELRLKTGTPIKVSL